MLSPPFTQFRACAVYSTVFFYKFCTCAVHYSGSFAHAQSIEPPFYESSAQAQSIIQPPFYESSAHAQSIQPPFCEKFCSNAVCSDAILLYDRFCTRAVCVAAIFCRFCTMCSVVHMCVIQRGSPFYKSCAYVILSGSLAIFRSFAHAQIIQQPSYCLYYTVLIALG